MSFITRTFLVAGLSLATSAAMLAQRGGFAGGRGGAPAAHSAAPGSRAFSASVGTAPLGTIAPASAGASGIRPGALRSYGGYGRGSYGRGAYGQRDFRRVPYAYFFAPYYYPYLGYADSAYLDSGYGPDPGYGYDAAADPNAQDAMMAANMLGDQVNRLNAEVEQLKYGQQPPPAPLPMQEPEPPQTPVTLVLRNGQQLKVQNYAVMDQTFWDFSSQPTRKIPISNIDIAASAKATIANGGDFPQLDTGMHDGQ